MSEFFEQHASAFVVAGALVAVAGLGVVVFTIREILHRRMRSEPPVARPGWWFRLGLAQMVVGAGIFAISEHVRSVKWARVCVAACAAEPSSGSRVRVNTCECLRGEGWTAVMKFDPSP